MGGSTLALFGICVAVLLISFVIVSVFGDSLAARPTNSAGAFFSASSQPGCTPVVQTCTATASGDSVKQYFAEQKARNAGAGELNLHCSAAQLSDLCARTCRAAGGACRTANTRALDQHFERPRSFLQFVFFGRWVAQDTCTAPVVCDCQQ